MKSRRRRNEHRSNIPDLLAGGSPTRPGSARIRSLLLRAAAATASTRPPSACAYPARRLRTRRVHLPSQSSGVVETTSLRGSELPADLIERPHLIVHQSRRTIVPHLLLLFTSFW